MPALPVDGVNVQVTAVSLPAIDAVPEALRVASAEAGTKRLAGFVMRM
jgi:hypothetical protein